MTETTSYNCKCLECGKAYVGRSRDAVLVLERTTYRAYRCPQCRRLNRADDTPAVPNFTKGIEREEKNDG